MSFVGKLLLLICCRSNGVVVIMARGTTICEAPTTCVLMEDENPSTVEIKDRDNSNNSSAVIVAAVRQRCLSREENLFIFIVGFVKKWQWKWKVFSFSWCFVFCSVRCDM